MIDSLLVAFATLFLTIISLYTYCIWKYGYGTPYSYICITIFRDIFSKLICKNALRYIKFQEKRFPR